MKTIALIAIVAAILFGGWYAKHEAVASFERAVATQKARSNV